MKKRFNFNRGNMIAEIEIELKEKEDKKTFSASGSIWEKYRLDSCMISGGQCLDTIQKHFKGYSVVNEIVDLWEKYHLNDMHAGTPKQEKFLKDNNVTSWANNYTETCKFLEENDLLVDNGNKFGCAWYYEEIPQEDLKRIEELLK